ncbi:transposase family protein, partial [Glutamicibacter ardleyensis]
MQKTSIWAALLGVEKTTVHHVDTCPETGVLLARVTPHKSLRNRCGICSRRCSRYDRGEGPRRWRTLDLGTTETYLVAHAPRVRCPEHGVIVAAV